MTRARYIDEDHPPPWWASVTKAEGRGPTVGAPRTILRDATDRDGQLITTATRISRHAGDGRFGGPAGRTQGTATCASYGTGRHAGPLRPRRTIEALYRLCGDPPTLHLDPRRRGEAGFPPPLTGRSYGISCRAVLPTYCEFDAPPPYTHMRRDFFAVGSGETEFQAWRAGDSFLEAAGEGRNVTVMTNRQRTVIGLSRLNLRGLSFCGMP